MQVSVIKHLQVVGDDERHDAVCEALFEEEEPTDTTVAILKRMYGFETLMQVEQIGKRLSRFGVVFGKQGFHFAPHIFRCGGFVTAYLIGQAFVFPDGEPLLAAVRCSRFEYCVQLFDKRFGNPLLGTIDNEVDATK